MGWVTGEDRIRNEFARGGIGWIKTNGGLRQGWPIPINWKED